MAKRPIFITKKHKIQLVEEISIDFTWHKGMAPSQKKKNVIELHKEAAKKNYHPLLEVSTKSDSELGIRLSAFNLEIDTYDYGFISLESAFQGSKIFKYGGPYIDLYGKKGGQIKKDERLKNSGALIGFKFEGSEWDLEPKTAFYDWLYINAVHRKYDLKSELLKYKGFTDIEFNPKKSINCQARSCALYVSLVMSEMIKEVLKNRSLFLDILDKDSLYQPHSKDKRQGKLF